MRRLLLVGRSEAGKTTLLQALRGEPFHYDKTQVITLRDNFFDSPGEYMQRAEYGAALALYAYEADMVGLVVSANEPYMLFSPCITSLVNREVIGIITGIDKKDANVPLVRSWLRLAGVKKIFCVCPFSGEGVEELLAYVREDNK